MMQTMRSSMVLSLFAAVALLAGCDDRQPVSYETAQGGAAQPELAKVRLQLNWVAEPEFGGFYAAHEKAIYAAEGLDVEMDQGEGSAASARLASYSGPSVAP